MTFKTPDVVDDTLERLPLTPDEQENAREFLRKFIKYGEYITIEFDTETAEAKVIPVDGRTVFWKSR